jgi:hypothetical protein
MNLPAWMKLDWLLGPRSKLTQPDAKYLRLMEIETSRENLKARIATAKAQKKAWVPMWEQLRDLTNEEDQLRARK